MKILTKYNATEFFEPIYKDMKQDKNNSVADGIAFMYKYGYIVSDKCIGRLLVCDGITDCKLFWDYNQKIAVDLPDSIRNHIRTFPIGFKQGKVFFMRKRDIESMIPRLTPLKQKKSVLRFSVGESNIHVEAFKNGLLLNQIDTDKKIFKGKSVRNYEDFQGNFEVNLFYFKEMALENFSECDIIGIRLVDNHMNIFISNSDKKYTKLEWSLRLSGE